IADVVGELFRLRTYLLAGNDIRGGVGQPFDKALPGRCTQAIDVDSGYPQHAAQTTGCRETTIARTNSSDRTGSALGFVEWFQEVFGGPFVGIEFAVAVTHLVDGVDLGLLFELVDDRTVDIGIGTYVEHVGCDRHSAVRFRLVGAGGSVLAGGEYENEHHGDECRADQQRTLRHAEYHSRSFILAQHIHGRRTRPPRTTTPASNMPGGEETGGKEIHPMGPAPPGMHYSAYSDCDCSLAPGERTQPWLIRAARLVSNAARNSSVVWWLWSPSTNS